MTEEVYNWIRDTSVFSPLVPLVFLFIYRKRQPKQNLILAVSIFLSLTSDVIGLTYWHHFGKPNNFVGNLYFIIALPAIMWFYHETVIRRSLKITIRIFVVSFLILASFFALEQGLNVVNYNTLTVSSVLVTVTSFFFVADLNLMDESNFLKNRFHETNIILNTSLALYYFVTIVLFALSDYVFSHATLDTRRVLWGFHNILNIFKHLGIAVAFYLSAKRSIALTNFSKIESQHHRNV